MACRRLIEMRNPHIDPINVMQVRREGGRGGGVAVELCHVAKSGLWSGLLHCPAPALPSAVLHPHPLPRPQVEILRRLRRQPDNQQLRDALLLSINGVAAGMRNTG
jgi:phosphoenolpyruvate carboxylase